MSRISLDPSARPVDLFAPTETRYSTAGSDLMQLGRALGGLSQEMADLVQVRHPGFVEEQSAAAAKVQAEKQFKNISDLKEAVRRGDLKDSDNPWFMVHLKQMVSRDFANRSLLEIQQELENDPAIQREDDVSKVEGVLNEKLARVFTDADQWTIGNLKAAADDFRGRYMVAHAEKRSQVRKAEFVDGLSRASEDFATKGDLAGLNGEIEKAAATGMEPLEIRDIITKAATRAALATEDPDLFDRTLDGLSIEGKTVGSLVTGSERTALRNEIEDRLYAREQRAYAKEQLEEVRQYKADLAEFDKAILSGQKVDLNQFPIETRLKFQGMMEQVQALEQSEFAREETPLLLARVMSGEEGPDIQKALLTLEVLGGARGASAASSLLRHMQRDDAATTGQIKALAEWRMDTSVSDPEKWDKLVWMAADGQITRAQFNQAAHEHSSLMASRGDAAVSPSYSLAMNRIKSAFDAHFAANAEVYFDFDANTGQYSLTPQASLIQESALQAVGRVLVDGQMGRLPPGTMLSDAIQQAADEQIKRYIGDNAAVSNEALIQKATSGDPVKFGLKYTPEEGYTIRGVDGQPVPLKDTPPVFRDLADLNTRFAQVSASMGIKGDAAETFKMDQLARLLETTQDPDQRRDVAAAARTIALDRLGRREEIEAADTYLTFYADEQMWQRGLVYALSGRSQSPAGRKAWQEHRQYARDAREARRVLRAATSEEELQAAYERFLELFQNPPSPLPTSAENAQAALEYEARTGRTITGQRGLDNPFTKEREGPR